ncbi:MAG: hypothetical protein A3D92_14045 [Bacteroidetes bacterium RIFCSPHIGHO2_02_FULL_44_7]|nr:MAG: hypothetical protein A3D92_14045 [Bacteroidetes bacterium RIFCSPHIGHO2_02_FULL_44_7]
MHPKHLHIVSLDVPFPPDYGGAIDIFFRIQALHQLGYTITLHCFEYGRGRSHEILEQCTSEVHYYSRRKPLLDWFSSIPFIVKTRRSKELLKRLLLDQHPILFEGLHTTYYLADERLKERLKIVRAHNVEHEYYSELALRAGGKERLFFRSEARKLRTYEKVLLHADHVLAIQENDLIHFQEFHPSAHLLPASIPHIRIQEGCPTKPYCLFHGNLSVAENEHAALGLARAFKDAGLVLIIAGKKPSDDLIAACKINKVDLRSNPSQEEMEELILQAQIHVLYTEQPTGLKLKLLSALSTQGHVLVNPTMVAGSSLGNYCTVTESLADFPRQATLLMAKTIDTEEIHERHAYLQEHFDTAKNCRVFDLFIKA